MSELETYFEFLADFLSQPTPHRSTHRAWQHWARNRHAFKSVPYLSFGEWSVLTERNRTLYDIGRTTTHVNMPLLETPMSLRVSKLVDRRINNNADKQKPSTRSGVMVTGWGAQGKTETVCDVAAIFEENRRALSKFLKRPLPGSRDLTIPVAYVQTPITAKPKSTCEAILDFYEAESKGMTLPGLVRQVAASLTENGTKALILDDITRLRMHRADDQDTLDLIRAFMSMNVTLVLLGVDIPGSGLLREGRWDAEDRQWVLPPSQAARVHGLEATQTERRFDLIELDRFRYDTPAQINDFVDHLRERETQTRLLKGRPGMLTEGSMPEYVYRRTAGVVGLVERLIEDGCQEAMDSEVETLNEAVLDQITLSMHDPGRDPTAGEVPQVPTWTTKSIPPASKPAAARRRGRNTVFDDHGENKTQASA